MIYFLITTAKLNDVDSNAWRADVLARTADQPARKLDQLLPWNLKARAAALQFAR
jgi:transposase